MMNTSIPVPPARNFDAIIIGTGQAGPPMAARFDEFARWYERILGLEAHDERSTKE
jgi:cation diffusion facilitator CzcD-associated flavoprotein CzcO